MTTAYFLTGSYNDIDNDFEFIVDVPPGAEQSESESQKHFSTVLTDISSENKVLWQTSHPSFLLCLKDTDDFLTENNITLYSKILTSPQRENGVDKELEGFILNRLE